MRDNSITVHAVEHGRRSQISFFALFLLFLIVPVEFNLNSLHGKEVSAAVSPIATRTPIYCPPPLILLEKTSLTPSRSNGISSGSLSDAALVTGVVVTAVAPEVAALNYKYFISGGRIVGEGVKVNWDLTGAAPGTYQITVAVVDKTGKKIQTATRTISLFPYGDDGDRCLGVCSSLSITAPPSSVQAGETMTFEANADRVILENLAYDWTVSDGEIVEGQGTPVIKVATNPQMAGKTVETTVNFKWDGVCWDICKKTASASGSVAARKNKGK